MYINAYTTPERIIRQLEKADSGDLPTEADSAYAEFFTTVKSYCVEISDWYTHTVFQPFVPYYEAKLLYFNELCRDNKLHNYLLTLPEPLVEVDQIDWVDTEVTSTYYRLLNGYRAQRTPYVNIQFDSRGITSGNGDFDDAITITGWWAYHSNYAQAYTSVEAVTANDSATTITVIDSTVYDTYDYIRLEDELIWITTLTDATTLTVERGVNGTTAAAHAAKTIQRYTVQPAVQHALTRFVAWAYDNRSNFGTLQFTDGSAVVQAMPTYVQETINAFMTPDIFGSI